MSRRWTGSGPEFGLEWGGRDWTLKLDDDRPGLYCEGRGPVLALEGLAAKGRRAPGALCGATLVGFEKRFVRVEATYAPPDWGELSVRATWSPSGDDGVDLLVQLSARSVGELKAVEAMLISTLGEEASARDLRSGAPLDVYPRDDRSAALSYDGREADVSALTTRAPGPIGPWPRAVSWAGSEGAARYVEMVHPDDFSRRIHVGHVGDGRETIRYGLFGYDLERGVVLRGRLRGVWSRGGDDHDAEWFARFLAEPLPLTT